MQSRALRHAAAIPVLFHDGRLCVTGLAVNVSSSGALVTNASEQPPVGTTARLRLLALQNFLYLEAPDSIELLAGVVRHEGRGFAVAFQETQAKIQELLELSFGPARVEGPAG